MLVNHLLKPKVLILLTAIFCIGIILGIFIPMLIGGGGSSTHGQVNTGGGGGNTAGVSNGGSGVVVVRYDKNQ